MLKHITPEELKQKLDETESQPLLLDVREPFEHNFCHIEGSMLIPMNEIPGKLDRIERERETVVICHHGIRSQQVAYFLLQQGYDNVLNLDGGIDAWALHVDPTMPRY